jgi:hypothetical protein
MASRMLFSSFVQKKKKKEKKQINEVLFVLNNPIFETVKKEGKAFPVTGYGGP